MSKLIKAVDVGTGNLIAAVQDDDGNMKYKTQRNAFCKIDTMNDNSTHMLETMGVNWVKLEDEYGQVSTYILGTHAHQFSNVFGVAPQRCMSNGVISPKEEQAIPLIKLILENMVGQADVKGEDIIFTIPANPIDEPFDSVFHQVVFRQIFEDLGYKATSVNEAHALSYSGLKDDKFSGISISCGAGMTNVCVTYLSMPAIEFSISRGGDWIDTKASQVTGKAIPEVQTIKEGMNLAKPDGREDAAILAYYRNLIAYVLENIITQFKGTTVPKFDGPVPIVLGGGTAMVDGFVPLFREEFGKQNFPVPISDIRIVEDPLHAIAEGALISGLARG